MSRLRLRQCALLLSLALIACGDDSKSVVPRDGGPAAASDCGVLVSSDGFAPELYRCPIRNTFSLVWPDGLRLAEAGLRFSLNGQTFTAADWPTASWQSTEHRTQLVLSGDDTLPRAELLITLSDPIVVKVSLQAEESLTLDNLSILWAGGPSGGLALRGTPATDFLSFGPIGQPPTISANATPRTFEQVFTTGDQSVHVGVTQPNFVIAPHSDAAENAVGIAIGSPTPLRLRPGRMVHFEVALTKGTTLESTLTQVSERQRTGDNAPPRFGWRSGAAYGVVINGARTEAAARWFSDADGRPLFVLDGLWFSALEEWTFGPAFPVVPTELDIDIVLAWPALRINPDMTDTTPADWVESTCSDGPCTLLNPGRPSVRDRIAREGVTLAERGIGLVEIPDVIPEWFDAIIESMSLASLPVVLPYPARSAADGMRILPERPLTDDACLTPLSAGTPQCLMRLMNAGVEEGLPRPGQAHLKEQAWGLATTWHHGSRTQLAPGPIHLLEQPLGQARQWASIIALAGGLYLLGDIPSQLSPEASEIFWAPWEAGAVQLGRPVYAGRSLPAIWQNSAALFLFNWGDERALYNLTQLGLTSIGSARSLFDERVFPEGLPDSIEVPPRDVTVFLWDQ